MAPPRLFVDPVLSAGVRMTLPEGPARHVQVLRLQPGNALTLFDGRGGEWSAQVVRMARHDVVVDVVQHHAVDRELTCRVTLAVGMPANDRMDTLIEKATELGVAVVQPLVCERSVMRLSGDRAQRKASHWQAVAIAASEQSGRTVVPAIEPVMGLAAWLASAPVADRRCVLSLRGAPRPLVAERGVRSVVFANGPEGGWSDNEEDALLSAGFTPVSLGARVLRADTAPLAALSIWGAPIG